MNLSKITALVFSLFALAGTTARLQAEPMPWKNPAYETTLRATQAESRPGPEEDPNSWTEWMRHHEDRKRWCTEQEVDLLMVGTNNRGIPELHGHDTAYGILALLKEIHAKLPGSKILLMPIFPRGDTPEDKGRLRNDEINKIIHTHVDGKTVHWLDIGHVFLDEEGRMNRDLMPDGLHPNEEGYRVWAKAMEPTLQKFLGEELSSK